MYVFYKTCFVYLKVSFEESLRNVVVYAHFSVLTTEIKIYVSEEYTEPSLLNKRFNIKQQSLMLFQDLKIVFMFQIDFKYFNKLYLLLIKIQ